MKTQVKIIGFLSAFLLLAASVSALEQFKPILRADAGSPGVTLPAIRIIPKEGETKTASKTKILGGKSKVLSLDIQGMDITEVLKIISDTSGWTIVCTPSVKGNVTLWIKDITVQELLDKVLLTNGFVYTREKNTITVMTQDEYARQYGQERKTFTVKNIPVKDLAETLKNLSFTSGKILVDPRTNQLVVIDTKERIAIMENIVNQLDLESKLVTEVFPLEYAKAEELSKSVEKFLSTAGIVQSDKATNQIIVTDTPANMVRIAGIIKKVEEPKMETASFHLENGLVEDIKTKLTTILPKDDGWFEVDKRTNTVIVSAFPHRIAQIKEAIGTFDEESRQVFVEARIMSVSADLLKELGVEWNATKNGVVKFSVNLPGKLTSTDAAGIFQVGNLSKGDYQVVLRALDSNSSTNLLSNPKIMVLNDQEAMFKVAAEQPYRTFSIVPQTGVQYEEVKFVTVGVTLTVTPHINKEGDIQMKVSPKITSLIDTVDKIPVVESREASSSVMVKDGETVVIGGLMKEEKTKKVEKVPLLGDIPLLGYFFRNNKDSKNKSELLIFITPHLVKNEIVKAEK